MKGITRAIEAMDVMGANLQAVGLAAGIAKTNLQRFVQEAAEIEKRQIEFEAAVASARTILDAEGYVQLQALTNIAFNYPDPRSFLDAVGTCVVAPRSCQCWWCRMKRFVQHHVGKAALVRKKIL